MPTACDPALKTDNSLKPSHDPRPDESLVASSLAGENGAFESLLRRHQQGVYGFLLRMVREPDEAADLAQEVFIKVFSSLEQFNPEYRFKTWLYRIAANAAVDRRRRRRNNRSFSDMGFEGEDGSALFPSRDPGPEEFLAARETRDALEAALADLPTSYRRVMLLRFQAGLRYDEIAAATNLPLGTVKNRVFRAREILRRALS